MRNLKVLSLLLAPVMFAACGDNDSDFASRPSGDSSSSGKSNSSVALATPCKTETEDNCEYGELVDDRDGQTYKTVVIGKQTWMAENLNYAYTGVPYKNEDYKSDSTSWCYKNDASNCTKYGRLYTWAAAMDSVGEWSTNGKGCGYRTECSPTYPVRGICPEGWHLPTKTEIETLLAVVGGQLTACKMLKSTDGWFDSGNGTDAFGFSALPAGTWFDGGTTGDDEGFSEETVGTSFWGSTENANKELCEMNLVDADNAPYFNYRGRGFGNSIRCVKD
jgi:uncharacterized protein (TIGR02145 family)